MQFGIIPLFLAGLGTFFTPCTLPIIPIYLGILLGTEKQSSKFKSVFPALAFILGFSFVFVLLGLGASTLGYFLVKYKLLFTIVAAGLIGLFGLKFLGVVHIGILDRDTRFTGSVSKTRFQSVNAFLLGFFFAFGWTPCVGPILGSVLSWTALKTTSPLEGALYLFYFSAGFAVPMLVAALFTAQAQKLFDKIKPRMSALEKALGVIMIVVALTLFFDAAKSFNNPSSVDPALPVAVNEKTVLAPDDARPSMVEFYSPNCGACRSVKPTVEKIAKHCEGQNVQIVLANVKEPVALKKAIAAGIRAIPTFIFYDASKKEVARLIGVQSERTLRNQLAAVLGHECPDLLYLEKEN